MQKVEHTVPTIDFIFHVWSTYGSSQMISRIQMTYLLLLIYLRFVLLNSKWKVGTVAVATVDLIFHVWSTYGSSQMISKISLIEQPRDWIYFSTLY